MADIIPSTDPANLYRLPNKTRNQLAADMVSSGTPEGVELEGKFAQTAELADPGTASGAAVVDAISANALTLSDVLEMQPVWVSGHSWQALDTNATPGTRWFQRLASRFRMGATTNKAVSGRTIGDICNLTLGGANAWPVRTKALVGLICTINDITLFDGSAASLVGYRHAWRAMLAQITANGLVAANTTSFVYTSGWTTEAVTGTSGSAQGATANSTGGTRWKTTTTGQYFEFTFTGTACDVFLVARAAGAGLATFTEGATTLGTLDLTAATAQDCPAIFRVRGLSAGTHTIRGTLTSGASLTVDSYRIPSTAPAPIIVCGEPEVIPAPTDHGTYWTDVQSFKTQLATICAEFPSVQYIDLDMPDWDTATMLVTDSNGGHKHPNDAGCAFIASKVTAVLKNNLSFSQGLNVTTSPTGYPAAYTPPAGPSVPGGGFDGTGGGSSIAPALPTGYLSRYKAATLPGSSGDVVTTWPDETGVADATGAVGAVLRTSLFRYLEFDGVDDALARAGTLAAPATYIMVMKFRTLTAGSSQIAAAGLGSSQRIIGKSSGGNWIANSGAALDSGVVTDTSWTTVAVTFNGASSKISVDSSTVVTATAGTNASATSFFLGRAGSAATYAPVDIAELVIYDRAFTDTELRAACLQLIADYSL